MGIWYFWESYQQELDKFQPFAVQAECTKTLPKLDRDGLDTNDQLSRFFLAVQRMPRAWRERPWSSHELLRANNTVANDLFRRKMKRGLGIR